MPTFLSDPSPTLLLILSAVVVVAGGVWFSKRSRVCLIVFASTLALAMLLFVLDRLFESPREEAVASVQSMVRAADTHNAEAFVAHLADKFEYQGEGSPKTVSRDEIRKAQFWGFLASRNVHIAAWDFAREDVREIDSNSVEIGFLAKAEAEGKPFPVYFKATFTRQPDGKMKLTRLASFDPLGRTNKKLTLPEAPFTP